MLTAVPSTLHEALLDLFRERPETAAELLHTVLGVRVPPYQVPRVVESTFSDLKPAQYFADLVIELDDGDPVLAIIVEAQRDYDINKRFSWPVYVTTLRARKRCPVCLLVLASEDALARWACEPIELGPSMGALTPLALGPSTLPVVTDREAARRAPEIAVLSALAHGNDPDGLQILTVMLSGVAELDEVRRDFYLDLVASQLNAAARVVLEAMMEAGQAGSEQLGFMAQLKSKLEAKLEAKLRAQIAQEMTTSEAQSILEAKAKAQAKSESLLTVLQARGLSVSEAVRSKILACMDLPTLDRWIARAATAPTADSVLADP